MQPIEKGVYGEVLFASRCIEKGYRVLTPLDPSSPYDLVVEAKGRLIKVQVKLTTTSPCDNRSTVKVLLERSDRSRYEREQVDYFAVYSYYFRGFFIIPFEDSVKTIRLGMKNKYSKYFNNFEFDF